MSLRVVRIDPATGPAVLRRLDAGPDPRPFLAAAKAEAAPVVFLICDDDLAYLSSGADLIEDLGKQHRARELHRILLGRKQIGLVRAKYSVPKRLLGAIDAFLARAVEQDDHNLSVIAVSATMFAHVWNLARAEIAPVFAPYLRLSATIPALDDDLIDMLPPLPVPHKVRDAFQGPSKGAERVRQRIVRYAPRPQQVLLLGETGTGKDIAAHALHDESGRTGPFIVVDCTTIPRELLGSELFGAEKGAFTDAKTTRDGLWLAAAGGTLFLDEVGELTPAHQGGLMRAIESAEVRRVGGTKSQKVDVRIVAATNRDLVQMVYAGKFRGDLYHRLHCHVIRTSPLRQYPEDIPALAGHFWRCLTENVGATLPAEVLAELSEYHWPGNNRELLGALTTLHTMVGPQGLTRDHVRAWFKTEAWAGDGGMGASPSVRELNYPVECMLHLRRADYVMRQAQLPLRDVMNGAVATPAVRHSIATSTMQRVQELETLCETPALFFGACDVVRVVKNMLRTFANMFPSRPDEALAYWKIHLEPAFAAAFTAIVKTIAQLTAEYGEYAVARRQSWRSRSKREAGEPASPANADQSERLRVSLSPPVNSQAPNATNSTR